MSIWREKNELTMNVHMDKVDALSARVKWEKRRVEYYLIQRGDQGLRGQEHASKDRMHEWVQMKTAMATHLRNCKVLNRNA